VQFAAPRPLVLARICALIWGLIGAILAVFCLFAAAVAVGAHKQDSGVRTATGIRG